MGNTATGITWCSLETREVCETSADPLHYPHSACGRPAGNLWGLIQEENPKGSSSGMGKRE